LNGLFQDHQKIFVKNRIKIIFEWSGFVFLLFFQVQKLNRLPFGRFVSPNTA
jgi:hypothetical protein